MQKTGVLIHAPTSSGKAIGGSAPNSVCLTDKFLAVSNGNNDTVQLLDKETLRIVRTISLSPNDASKHLRGVIPSGMAFDAKRNRLYVCESGINSVAAIDTKTWKVIGRIPSGWFPMQVRLAPGGTLLVACQKGIGRGPQGPKSPRLEGDERYGLGAMPGMIQRVAAPSEAELKNGWSAVVAYNGIGSKPPVVPKRHPGIKHVVFITKENHTFDGIFGALKGADGEPDYAEWGQNGWIQELGKNIRLPIMPNHIDLATKWSISDNFYMEPQGSGDGHRWLVGVYPSLWTTRVYYSGWGFRPSNAAKGRLVSFSSNGSQIPEDYLENG